ncbi:odorant receptor 4-like [Chironomus tepperi]|uniref:odorant receptor 4-like n=1 Tax=Chironomus tepperi TaxID=113505 RepID=UPI00391EF41B
MQLLIMELDILGKTISKIRFENEEEEEVKVLKKLVKIHQELIEISEILEEIFSPILLINAFGSISSLCTACFLAVTGISGYFIAKYFMFPIVLPLQAFFQCYFAQKLIDSSTMIATSAYKTDWYESSVKTQRLILLIMVRAQKPQTVTAFKFFDVSIETFQWIISTSYSYFSILQGMYG